MNTPTITPLPAGKALEAYFLEARSKLLDLAGVLDRISRGDGVAGSATDPRLGKIRQALEILQDTSGERAERIQQVFSLTYDPAWDRPESSSPRSKRNTR